MEVSRRGAGVCGGRKGKGLGLILSGPRLKPGRCPTAADTHTFQESIHKNMSEPQSFFAFESTDRVSSSIVVVVVVAACATVKPGLCFRVTPTP